MCYGLCMYRVPVTKTSLKLERKCQSVTAVRTHNLACFEFHFLLPTELFLQKMIGIENYQTRSDATYDILPRYRKGLIVIIHDFVRHEL